ncbi:hypothetical protein PV08_06420 [Exophiala spinifera]|uniref:BZIP domain-containing protein n=1 Tax=Exophiala spinifera TaxID=91928 RepID=A0A0D2BYH1_9EURO|nr:uncharacterized protein PV08_06420 [Exophiala spinifera]KIW16369.1 hypothetical protein PV08_06420 [Exophiala spinifera]
MAIIAADLDLYTQQVGQQVIDDTGFDMPCLDQLYDPYQSIVGDGFLDLLNQVPSVDESNSSNSVSSYSPPDSGPESHLSWISSNPSSNLDHSVSAKVRMDRRVETVVVQVARLTHFSKKERRRRQNRVSQAAFRQRKDQELASLKNQVRELLAEREAVGEIRARIGSMIDNLVQVMDSLDRERTATSPSPTNSTSLRQGVQPRRRSGHKNGSGRD